MDRTSISLPSELVEDLDAELPDEMTREEQFREVVLPALRGEQVDITVDGDAGGLGTEEYNELLDRLDDLEDDVDEVSSQVDEVPTLTSSKTVSDLRETMR